MADRSLTRVQGGTTDTIHINTDKFAGVRTMSKTVGTAHLTDATTSIQVTVAGHADLDGLYTGSPHADAPWNQQGGNGQILTSGYNSELDSQEWFINDLIDQDPTQGDAVTSWQGGEGADRPWKANLALAQAVTITGIAGTETVTVDRTAQVIDSDRKGESRPLLSKVVGGAAAAYSLRDLNDKQGNNKVVRVRRASDNNERDFLAKEVSNGTLQNWVNTQTVLPLDIQALTDDGRTGSVIPAKAAYSLRNLSKNYTGNVVDVRRSSDDTEQGFTAAQVTDGTLLSFVNEIQTLGTVTNSAHFTGFTLTNASSTGFTATTDTATGVCGWLYTAKAGDKITVSFDAVVRAGTPQFVPRKASALSSSNLVDVVSDSAISVNSTASYSFEFTYDSDEAGSLTFSEGDDNADFDISNFQVTSFKGNGHVSKWYDQSGEDNHAVQATPASQPKIVDAGSLVTGGIDFLDGTDTFLETTNSDLCNVTQLSAFTVLTPHIASSQLAAFSCGATVAGSTGYGGWEMNFNGYADLASFQTQAKGDSTSGVNGIHTAQTGVTSSEALLSFVSTFPNASISKNGGTAVTTSSMNAPSQPSTDRRRFRIGCKFTFRVSNFYPQPINEIILYDTDQSDNRTAIEANIGEAYSIDLPSGVDSGENQVDGFVETWYDQSGENFNMTQAESTKQPKIVENGNFLGSVKYDGSTSYLKAASMFNITNQAVSLFSVQTPVGANDSTLGASHSGRGISFENSVVRVFITQSAHVDNHVGGGSGFLIGSAIHTGDGSSDQIKTSRNGVPVVDPSPNSNDVASDAQPIYTTQYNVLGGNRVQTSNSNFFNGEIKEVVIWKTNQLANRPAIEANINNQYDIY